VSVHWLGLRAERRHVELLADESTAGCRKVLHPPRVLEQAQSAVTVAPVVTISIRTQRPSARIAESGARWR